MHMEMLMVFEPAFHFGMFVGGVVVTNDVDRFIRRRTLVDESQKF